jgi:DNA repair protein RadC
MKLKNIPKIELPREKLIKYGPEKLSEPELLAILLRSGQKGQNVIELSKKIIKKFNTSGIIQAKYKDLKNIPGLGPAKACEIVACFELGKRLLKEKKVRPYLTPKDVWEECKDIRDNKKEHFMIFYLDSRSQEIKRDIISIGTLNSSLVHPREVFEPAVRHVAAHIIAVHNHPSGDLEPSEADILLTKRLHDAGKIIGIELLDHIIVTKTDFLSLKENNLF